MTTVAVKSMAAEVMARTVQVRHMLAIEANDSPVPMMTTQSHCKGSSAETHAADEHLLTVVDTAGKLPHAAARFKGAQDGEISRVT